MLLALNLSPVIVPFAKRSALMLLGAIAAVTIFGAFGSPSAIAIGLSRNASASMDRAGFPGSRDESGMSVQVAMSLLTASYSQDHHWA